MDIEQRTHDSTSAIDDDPPELHLHRGGLIRRPAQPSRIGERGPEAFARPEPVS